MKNGTIRKSNSGNGNVASPPTAPRPSRVEWLAALLDRLIGKRAVGLRHRLSHWWNRLLLPEYPAFLPSEPKLRKIKNEGDSLYARFYALVEIASRIVPEYRFTWPNMTWWHDEAFNVYLQRFEEANSFNQYRRWNVLQLLRLVAAVPGDTAECGVYRGAMSYLICKANEAVPHHRRTHHLCDSFAGLSQPAEQDGTHWTEGDLGCPLEEVQRNLSDCPATAYHKGWIPDCFATLPETRYSCVHIDVDLYQPTLDSLAYFYPRMNPGGILICDDYGHTTCPGAIEAVDGFLRDKPEKMLTCPAGGGFLIRGITTAP